MICVLPCDFADLHLPSGLKCTCISSLGAYPLSNSLILVIFFADAGNSVYDRMQTT